MAPPEHKWGLWTWTFDLVDFKPPLSSGANRPWEWTRALQSVGLWGVCQVSAAKEVLYFLWSWWDFYPHQEMGFCFRSSQPWVLFASLLPPLHSCLGSQPYFLPLLFLFETNCLCHFLHLWHIFFFFFLMAQGTVRSCDVGLGRSGIRVLGTPRMQQADQRGAPTQLQGGRHSVPEQKQA